MTKRINKIVLQNAMFRFSFKLCDTNVTKYVLSTSSIRELRGYDSNCTVHEKVKINVREKRIHSFFISGR